MKKVIILILFLSFEASVKAESYVCFDEKRDQSVRFFNNDQKVSINHISFQYRFSFVSNYADPLEGHMKSGTYNIKKNSEKIILNYIQNTVNTKIELPSKELVGETDARGWDNLYNGKYKYISRYHATFPAVHTYTFDRVKKQILKSITYPFSPRKVTKTKFSVHSDGKAYPERRVTLSQEEANDLFSKSKNQNHSYLYPYCETLSFRKRILNDILSVLFLI